MAKENPFEEAASLSTTPDEFAYKVAICAWKDGLAPNGIARALGLDSSPVNLMRVKRALRRAQQQFLRIEVPMHEQLQAKLRQCFNRSRGMEFHVVEDDWKNERQEPIESGFVCLKAAEVATEIIKEVLDRTRAAQIAAPAPSLRPDGLVKEKQPEVVICNAGGRSISDTVKAMRQNPPVLDESDQIEKEDRSRILFVAGNRASQSKNFQRSANFLSVTMAEIYGAEHEAFSFEEDAAFLKKHRSLVENSALFICGAGSCKTGLMTRHLRDRNYHIPDEAVGDIAFNLLDKDGRPVELEERARAYVKTLNPTLDVDTIRQIAGRSRVLLVLDSKDPTEKKEIGIAILRREYPTDVVLGTRLARAILRECA